MLLTFLRWLKKNSDIDFSILLMDEGDIVDQFREVGPTFVLHAKTKARLSLLERVLGNKLKMVKLARGLRDRPRDSSSGPDR